jgi:hypothetical protein
MYTIKASDSLFQFLTILLFFSCKQAPDITPSKKQSNGDTSFTLYDFKEKVETDKTIVSEPFTNPDTARCIELIKVYNTISYYSLQDSVYTSFSRYFDKNYLMNIVNVLGCEVTVGMGFYCSKYNINIGGASRFAPGTYFKIDSLHEKMEVH